MTHEPTEMTDGERTMFQFGLSPDPQSAAEFSGNEYAIIATVVAVGEAEAVTVTPGSDEGLEGQPPVTYPFARVDVRVDESLFGGIPAGSQITVRDLLGGEPDPEDPPPSAYEVGGQYVLMLNPAVDVAGTGLMQTPNWTFPVRGGELLWSDPDVGTDQALPLEEFRQAVAENPRAGAGATTIPAAPGG